MILNPDTILDRTFIDNAVNKMNKDHGIGSISGKVLQLNENTKERILDSTGIFVDYFYRCYDRGQFMADDGRYDLKNEIFAASGCVAFYRKTMLEDICVEGKYFDEDFFAYYEDLDIGWRSIIAGWKVVYEPACNVCHYRQTKSAIRGRKGRKPAVFVQAHIIKNRYLLLVKNENFSRFIILLLPFIFYESLRSLYLLLNNPISLIKGYKGFFAFLPSALRQRKIIQKRRLVKARTLWPYFKMRERV